MEISKFLDKHLFLRILFLEAFLACWSDFRAKEHYHACYPWIKLWEYFTTSQKRDTACEWLRKRESQMNALIVCWSDIDRNFLDKSDNRNRIRFIERFLQTFFGVLEKRLNRWALFIVLNQNNAERKQNPFSKKSFAFCGDWLCSNPREWWGFEGLRSGS